MKHKTIPVEGCVFPSTLQTISVVEDPKYGSAHTYFVLPLHETIKHNDKYTPVYADDVITIQFVQRLEDGQWISGIQDEQLAYIMLDRTKKLNEKSPSAWNKIKIKALELFLYACKFRIKERIANNKFTQLVK